MDKIIERLKNEFSNDDARYAYADSVTNAFLTGQIKELREARELTQERLAELVGTQQSGISRWQRSGYSSCKVETLRKFARAFGVRLRISFEPFGTLPTDVGGFTKERLAPPSFEDDPAFNERAAEQENTTAAAMARSRLKQQLIPQSERRYSLAGATQAEGIPGWESRLDLAIQVMELKEQFPRLFENLAGAKKVPVRDIPEDRYKGLGLVPQQPKPIKAITPATDRDNNRNAPFDPIQVSLDFPSEDKEAA